MESRVRESMDRIIGFLMSIKGGQNTCQGGVRDKVRTKYMVFLQVGHFSGPAWFPQFWGIASNN